MRSRSVRFGAIAIFAALPFASGATTFQVNRGDASAWNKILGSVGITEQTKLNADVLILS